MAFVIPIKLHNLSTIEALNDERNRYEQRKIESRDAELPERRISVEFNTDAHEKEGSNREYGLSQS